MKALRLFLALAALGALYFGFWPVPVDPVAWDAPVDRGLVDSFTTNERLDSAQMIELSAHHGPEDVTIGFGGLLYVVTEGGQVVSLQPDGGDLQVFAEVGGRPLGIEYGGGFLYIANAYLGLQRITEDSRVLVVVDEFDGVPIGYADDVAVAQDGSSRFAAKDWGGTYAASLLDIMEHGGHGRVLKYDPASNETTLVMDNLNFANGIAISEDQQYLLVNETGSYRVWRYWLEGLDTGSSEVILDNLPGFPDNINNGLNGRYWIGLIAPRVAVLDRASGNPSVRKIMQRMPAALRPQAVPSSHLIAIDGDGRVLMDLQDSEARFPSITGAIETDQAIYVTSLFGNRLARIAKGNL
jgi:sugar lactone lactonase YvrE